MAAPSITTSNGPAARSALVTEATRAPVFAGSGVDLHPRDLEPTIGSVPGFSFLGCYTDIASPRILGSTMGNLNVVNNPVECCAWCANQDTSLSICGVEDSTQCFCDSQMEATASNRLAPSSECSLMCVGNDNILCGAAGRIDVYSATINFAEQTTLAATPTPATVPGYSYLGCVSDSTARLLTKESTTESVFMNAEYCCALCLNLDNGNVVCGVEASSECYCDNRSATSNVLPANAADCHMPCVGYGDQLCGGSYRLNLYQATAATVTSEGTSGHSVDSTDGLFPTSTHPDTSSSAQTNTQSSSPSPGPHHGGLHGGAIAGVVVGSLAGVALIAGLAYFAWARRRRHHLGSPPQPPPAEVPGDMKYGYTGPGPYQLDADAAPAAGVPQNTLIYELQGNQAAPHE